MKRMYLFSFILLLVLQGVFSQEIKVGVGLALPPYIIQGSNSGIEVEILQQALPASYKTKLIYLPFARVPISLTDGTADAVLTINESSGVKDAFYSNSHIKYQNVVLSLKSKNLKISKISDLSKLSIVAFQDATAYLGADFAAMAKANAKYSEIPEQDNQVKMLFASRADVIITDINIFKYFKSKITDIDVSKEYVVHEIFAPTEYKVGFKSKDVRDLFNVGLQKLKDTGKYAAILTKYTK